MSMIVFDMSMGYILVAFFAVCVNNVLVEGVPFTRRIRFGYIVSCSALLFVLVFEIGWDAFDPVVAYHMNLVAVACVAFGCTGEQPLTTFDSNRIKSNMSILDHGRMRFRNLRILSFQNGNRFLFGRSATVELLWVHQHATKALYTGGDDGRK